MTILVKAYGKKTLLCEGCGKEVKSEPWPEGWYTTGKSRRRIRDNGTSMGADWCPDCNANDYDNPAEYEIVELWRAELSGASRGK